MLVPLGPSRFPMLVWRRAALVGLALLKFLLPRGADRDGPSLRASLVRPNSASSVPSACPSIRRALPVWVGGLLCAVVSPAMAQQVDTGGYSLISTPLGGPSGNRQSVYIIGNTIEFAVTHIADLQDPGSPRLKFRIGTQTRETDPCTLDSDNAKRLLCKYMVKEGDASGNANIVVPSGTPWVGSFRGRGLGEDTTLTATVDGVRLALNSIGVTGLVGSVGFNAGSTIALALTFGDGRPTPETACRTPAVWAQPWSLRTARNPHATFVPVKAWLRSIT